MIPGSGKKGVSLPARLHPDRSSTKAIQTQKNIVRTNERKKGVSSTTNIQTQKNEARSQIDASPGQFADPWQGKSPGKINGQGVASLKVYRPRFYNEVGLEVAHPAGTASLHAANPPCVQPCPAEDTGGREISEHKASIQTGMLPIRTLGKISAKPLLVLPATSKNFADEGSLVNPSTFRFENWRS